MSIKASTFSSFNLSHIYLSITPARLIIRLNHNLNINFKTGHYNKFMGSEASCFPSIFNQINKREGEALKKFAAKEKGKEYLLTITKQSKIEVSKIIKQHKQMLYHQIQDQEIALDMIFSEFRQSLNPSFLFEFGVPQKYGIDIAKLKLYNLKKDLLFLFSSLQASICQQMQENKRIHQQFMDSQVPQPKIWYFLERKQRKDVIQQAAKHYKPAVARAKRQVYDFMHYQLDPKGYLPRIQREIPLSRIHQLTEQATLKLEKGIMLIRQSKGIVNQQFIRDIICHY